jgi:hypothetical protein
MARVRLAALICSAALLAGLGLGLLASAGGGDDAADPVKPAGVRLERLAAPAVGAIDVPALKLPRRPGRVTTTTTTPPPPVPPPPIVVPPPIVPPPPPPPPPPSDPDITRR